MADRYRAATTAFVLVDPYNDFLAEGAKIYPRLKEIAESVDLHQHVRELVADVPAAGIRFTIAQHHRWRPGEFEGWLHPGRTVRTISDGRCSRPAPGAATGTPDATPREGDIVASEHWVESGFANTDLDMHLRQHGIEHIILAGLTAPGCVEGTGRFGYELGYSITLVKDATASFTKEWMHEAVELNAPIYAESVLTTAEAIARIEG
jgi:nicotinamidase-related amidase